MFTSLVATAGVFFVIASAFLAAAVFVEQAGAARSPEEDQPHGGLGAIGLWFAALLAPALLLMHAYFITEHHDDDVLRIAALGAPLVMVTVGALLGAIFGAIVRGAAPTMRMLAPWFALIALALAAYATRDTVVAVIAAIQSGGPVVLRAP